MTFDCDPVRPRAAHPDPAGPWPSASDGSHRTSVGSYRQRVMVAVAAFSTVLATNLVDLQVNHLRPDLRLLDANWQFSWSHDVDRMLLGVGVLAAAAAMVRPEPQRRLWCALASVLACLLLVEVTPLHAIVGHTSKLLYVPILLALVVCVWRLAVRTAERGVVVLALLTLLTSFAMHVVGLTLLRQIGYMTVPYQVGVAIKEGGELAGLILLTPSLWQLGVGGARVGEPSP